MAPSGSIHVTKMAATNQTAFTDCKWIEAVNSTIHPAHRLSATARKLVNDVLLLNLRPVWENETASGNSIIAGVAHFNFSMLIVQVPRASASASAFAQGAWPCADRSMAGAASPDRLQDAKSICRPVL